jgi:hypothetical protein
MSIRFTSYDNLTCRAVEKRVYPGHADHQYRNMNDYGVQADDSGAKGNDYNEAI